MENFSKRNTNDYNDGEYCEEFMDDRNNHGYRRTYSYKSQATKEEHNLFFDSQKVEIERDQNMVEYSSEGYSPARSQKSRGSPTKIKTHVTRGDGGNPRYEYRDGDNPHYDYRDGDNHRYEYRDGAQTPVYGQVGSHQQVTYDHPCEHCSPARSPTRSQARSTRSQASPTKEFYQSVLAVHPKSHQNVVYRSQVETNVQSQLGVMANFISTQSEVKIKYVDRQLPAPPPIIRYIDRHAPAPEPVIRYVDRH